MQSTTYIHRWNKHLLDTFFVLDSIFNGSQSRSHSISCHSRYVLSNKKPRKAQKNNISTILDPSARQQTLCSLNRKLFSLSFIHSNFASPFCPHVNLLLTQPFPKIFHNKSTPGKGRDYVSQPLEGVLTWNRWRKCWVCINSQPQQQLN